MEISLVKLLSRDGASETHRLPLEISEIEIGGTAYPVLESQPVEITLTHEGDYVLKITGGTKLKLELSCARCLCPVEKEFLLDFDRKIDFNLTEEEREDLEEDSAFVDKDVLNVEALIRNELLVQWPIRVLCKDDCKGICSRCGANLNFQTCDCDTTVPDPRMAAIRDIFSKFKEV
ncbi:MAG TPA: DUF177 domain-containing protein [Candidatus Fusicatenibacter merdavium]|uniref:DUF177 domain-containing protein n=1 Tax=Candidatus Fusicatenibacter merdavium TaxID=2838600 RepID=A0A9D2BIA4_9FIRM|nr:DUF177 domain-containing protein [Candidatus Fusicatenibacter merdavium]